MKLHGKWARMAGVLAFGGLAASWALAARSLAQVSSDKNERARVTLSHDLPRLNGDKLSVTVVEVNYGPGESSSPHSHTCPVIGYVVEGTLRTQVQDEPEAIYKPGESFYEAPNGVHLVSANASDKGPAKFLAFFVCDHETPRSVDVPKSKPAGKE
jgi:quercetin dioxygenase-like cupin family protein